MSANPFSESKTNVVRMGGPSHRVVVGPAGTRGVGENMDVGIRVFGSTVDVPDGEKLAILVIASD
jgi:hypothetical protein